jgi:hypothetical protein
VVLGVSVTGNHADEQKRRLLLPHVSSILEYDNGQLFAPSPDLFERFIAILNIHRVYIEGGKFQKISRSASLSLV